MSPFPCGYTALVKGFSNGEGWTIGDSGQPLGKIEKEAVLAPVALQHHSPSLFPGTQLFLSAFMLFPACATLPHHSTSPA